MIDCGKRARRTGGNRHACKRAKRANRIGNARYAAKRERWAKNKAMQSSKKIA